MSVPLFIFRLTRSRSPYSPVMDVTELILNDHHDQRRLFSYLDDIDGSEVAALGAIWSRLSTLLEVHAAAEEALFYPELLKLGTRGPVAVTPSTRSPM